MNKGAPRSIAMRSRPPSLAGLNVNVAKKQSCTFLSCASAAPPNQTQKVTKIWPGAMCDPRQKAMPPGWKGSPPEKENISPALADPGDTFWPGPPDTARAIKTPSRPSTRARKRPFSLRSAAGFAQASPDKVEPGT